MHQSNKEIAVREGRAFARPQARMLSSDAQERVPPVNGFLGVDCLCF